MSPTTDTKECTMCLEMLPKKPLRQQLDQATQEAAANVPPDKFKLIQDRTEALNMSDMLTESLGVGDVAPEFSLLDTEGNCVQSEELITAGGGPLILVFFRGGWCGHCTTTLRALRQYAPHYLARGAKIVAVSPQVPEVNDQLAWDQGLNFPLLSDIGCALAQEFGIAFEMDEEMAAVYEELAQVSVSQGGSKDYILPLPATFILNRHKDGTSRISYAYVNTDSNQRAEPMDILNSLPPLSSDVRSSLRYKLNLRYSMIQENEINSGGVKIQSMNRIQQEIEQSPVLENALQQGDTLPENPLVNSLIDPSTTKLVKFSRLFRHGGKNSPEGRRAMLHQRRRGHVTKGPIVLTFVQGRSDPFYQVFLETMQQNYSQFVQRGAANVVAVTPSKYAEELCQTSAAHDIIVLQDIHSWFADEIFGVAHDFIDRSSLSEFRVQSDSPVKVPVPSATYVIDADAKTILYSFISADHTKRAEPSDILRALDMATHIETATTSSSSLTSSINSASSSPDSEELYPIKPASQHQHKRRGPFSLKIHGWKPFHRSVRPVVVH